MLADRSRLLSGPSVSCRKPFSFLSRVTLLTPHVVMEPWPQPTLSALLYSGTPSLLPSVNISALTKPMPCVSPSDPVVQPSSHPVLTSVSANLFELELLEQNGCWPAPNGYTLTTLGLLPFGRLMSLCLPLPTPSITLALLKEEGTPPYSPQADGTCPPPSPPLPTLPLLPSHPPCLAPPNPKLNPHSNPPTLDGWATSPPAFSPPLPLSPSPPLPALSSGNAIEAWGSGGSTPTKTVGKNSSKWNSASAPPLSPPPSPNTGNTSPSQIYTRRNSSNSSQLLLGSNPSVSPSFLFSSLPRFSTIETPN